MLAIFTVLHFLVDGTCAAAMAAYAVQETSLAPIVYFFGLYNAIAFGSQWLTGWLLDKKENWTRYAFLFVLVTLASGAQPALGIAAQTVLLGIGNSVFHVAAGRLVLQQYNTYKELGIFVSSGAVGLALGLNCIVGTGFFLAACTVLCAVLTYNFWKEKLPEKVIEKDTPAENVEENLYSLPGSGRSFSVNTPFWLSGICLILLLGCVVLRGFGGVAASPYVMLFPCVFAAGKALGGMICDRAGYQKTILFIFLLSFTALQLSGLVAAVLLVLAFNMTMPLTLRLVHWCNPDCPGMMFGLAAGCLLPGVFCRGFSVPPHAMAVLQFICLAAAGWLLWKGSAKWGQRTGNYN